MMRRTASQPDARLRREESMGFQQKSRTRTTGIAACILLGLMVAACSSHEPKPMAQPTPDQVRGHADRGFDKLKQEEQERGAQSNVAR
jgi:hypothetical protein